MLKNAINCICPKLKLFTILFIFSVLTPLMPTELLARVVIKCPASQQEQCKSGSPVMEEMLKRLGESDVDFLLYDAKPSKIVKGYWTFIFKDTIAEKNFLVYTDGTYIVPNVMPILPGRDMKHVEGMNKTPELLAAIEKENRRQAQSLKTGMPQPINQLLYEHNGMFLGPIDIDKWVTQKKAFLLVKGASDRSKIILVDDLVRDTAARFIDEFKDNRDKWPDKGASVYFIPFFGVMGNKISASIGKFFYSMIEAGAHPLDAVYNLSKLQTASKINQGTLREYCISLVDPAKKATFLRVSMEIPSETVIGKNDAAFSLGIMIPSYYIENGQFKLWGFN